MGFALSWIGIRGMSPEAAVEKAGFRLTGHQEEFPESPVTCARLESGWCVIVMNRSMDAHDGSIDPSQFLPGAEIVTCMLEEHVMASGFSRWTNGERVLSVEHDSQQGARHLEISGNLSSEAKAIIEEATSSQNKEDEGDAEVDFFFDIPINIAYGLTGFRHDHANPDGVAARFEVLDAISRRHRGSWWKSLFRRGGG
jgi:hypothetical protein